MKTLQEEYEEEIWTRIQRTRIVEYFPTPGERYNSECDKLLSIPADQRTKEENSRLELIKDQLEKEIRRLELLNAAAKVDIKEMKEKITQVRRENIQIIGLSQYNQFKKEKVGFLNLHILKK